MRKNHTAIDRTAQPFGQQAPNGFRIGMRRIVRVVDPVDLRVLSQVTTNSKSPEYLDAAQEKKFSTQGVTSL